MDYYDDDSSASEIRVNNKVIPDDSKLLKKLELDALKIEIG